MKKASLHVKETPFSDGEGRFLVFILIVLAYEAQLRYTLTTPSHYITQPTSVRHSSPFGEVGWGFSGRQSGVFSTISKPL